MNCNNVDFIKNDVSVLVLISNCKIQVCDNLKLKSIDAEILTP